jgi:hypothetical protein
MRYYKFIQSEHVERVLNEGTLRISSLEFFSYLEEVHGNAWIGDVLERGSEIIQDEPLDASDPANAETVEFLAKTIGVSYHGTKRVSGEKYMFVQPPTWIYSCSYGGLDLLEPVMCGDRVGPEYRYDSCLEITDLEGLRESFRSARVVELAAPVSDIFKGMEADPVKYDEKRRKVHEHRMPAFGPFVKSPAYASQCEYRMVLEARDKNIPDVLTIRIDTPTDYFKEVFRAKDVGRLPATAGYFPASDAEVENRLSGLLDAIRMWTARNPEPKYIPPTSGDSKTAAEAWATWGDEQSEWSARKRAEFNMRLLDALWAARLVGVRPADAVYRLGAVSERGVAAALAALRGT